ncbi:MAG: hypothetical protein ACFFDT_23490, partial [Candidatus Hodarchaeota archaeon]
VFQKNPEEHQYYFDIAKYHMQRMQDLSKLGKHYPLTDFIETKHQILALQEFLFCPIVTFSSLEEIEELFDIMLLASKEGLFLDYNQNHWLVCKPRKGEVTLYYVDKDYNSQKMSFEEAVRQNFSQSILFLNLSNVSYYCTIIEEFKNANREKKFFNKIVLELLRQYLNDLVDRTQTPALIEKSECFKQILSSQKRINL